MEHKEKLAFYNAVLQRLGRARDRYEKCLTAANLLQGEVKDITTALVQSVVDGLPPEDREGLESYVVRPRTVAERLDQLRDPRLAPNVLGVSEALCAVAEEYGQRLDRIEEQLAAVLGGGKS